MKIIKHGKKKSDREAFVTCSDCGCEFMCARHEGRYVSDQRDGDAVVVKCPDCKNEEWISTHKFK